MRAAVLAAAATLAGAAVVPWYQDCGGANRWSRWPDSGTINAPEGAAAAAPREAAAAAAVPHEVKMGAAPASPVPVPSIQFQLSSSYHVSRPPAPVIMKDGTVVGVSDDCDIYVLPNPDTMTAPSVWNPYFINTDFVNSNDRNNCPSLVTDDKNRIFVAACGVNTLKCYLGGYAMQYGSDGKPASLARLPWSTWPFPLASTFKAIETHDIGMLYTTAGELWIPTSSQFILSPMRNGGLLISGLSTTAPKSTPLLLNSLTNVFEAGLSATGSVRMPNPTLVGNDAAVFLTANYSGLASGTAAVAYDAGGTELWRSSVQHIIDDDQQHPILDPTTNPESIYFMSFRDNAPASRVAFNCIRATDGTPCSPVFAPNGNPITDNFGGFKSEWFYSGAVLPKRGTAGVERVIYTLTNSPVIDPANPNPEGCVIAIDPVQGGIVDSYCLPRPAGSLDFIGTGPLVAVDQTGSGVDKVLFLREDSAIFVFDARNLGQGPLYVSFPYTTSETGDVSADYIAMTGNGALLFTAWREDAAGYLVVAVPNILSPPSGGGGGNNNNNGGSSGGLDAGGAVGVTLVVVAAAAGVGFMFYSGRWTLPNVAGMLNGAGGSYKAFSGYNKVASWSTSKAAPASGSGATAYSDIGSGSGSGSGLGFNSYGSA